MSTEENKALVQRAWDALWREDPDTPQYYAPGYCMKDTLDEPLYWDTIDKLLVLISMWKRVVPDISVTIEDSMAEGNYVTSRVLWRGTHQGDFPWGPHPPYKPSGKPVAFGEIVISRIVDGKIAEQWFAMDFNSVWQQFGALPA